MFLLVASRLAGLWGAFGVVCAELTELCLPYTGGEGLPSAVEEGSKKGSQRIT